MKVGQNIYKWESIKLRQIIIYKKEIQNKILPKYKYKISNKTLASKNTQFTQRIIHCDQEQFIPKMQSLFDILTPIDVILLYKMGKEEKSHDHINRQENPFDKILHMIKT